MEATTAAGIAMALYCGAPMLAFAIEYAAKSRNKSIKLETFPVANTLTHVLFSVFLLLGLFLDAMWAYIVAGVIYFIKFVVMVIVTKEVRYAQNTRNERTTQQFLEDLRLKMPKMSIYVRCWHTEVYYTTEHYTDSNGKRCARQQRHEREVTTFTETRHIQITGWYDETPPLVLPEIYRQRNVISLHLHTAIDYYKNSHSVVQMMLADAYSQNSFRDRNCSTTLNKEVPGLTEYNYLAEKLPLYMRRWFIVISLLLAFDSPLMLHIRSNTPHCELVVKKVVSMLPNKKDAGADQQVPISPPEMAQPDAPTDITPPLYFTDVDEITPPVQIMTNEQPLFVDTVTAPLDFDNYAFNGQEAHIATDQQQYTANILF